MSNGSTIPGKCKETLLEHEVRRAIYGIVEERPGLNTNQIADELDVYPMKVSYHVDRMVVNGVLEGVRAPRGGELLLFLPSQQELWTDDQTLVLFGRAPLRLVALYVAEHPGATSKEMATVLGVTPATVRHHLRTLRERNLVAMIRTASATSYHPTHALKMWVDQVGGAYERPWTSSDTT